MMDLWGLVSIALWMGKVGHSRINEIAKFRINWLRSFAILIWLRHQGTYFSLELGLWFIAKCDSTITILIFVLIESPSPHLLLQFSNNLNCKRNQPLNNHISAKCSLYTALIHDFLFYRSFRALHWPHMTQPTNRSLSYLPCRFSDQIIIRINNSQIR